MLPPPDRNNSLIRERKIPYSFPCRSGLQKSRRNGNCIKPPQGAGYIFFCKFQDVLRYSSSQSDALPADHDGFHPDILKFTGSDACCHKGCSNTKDHDTYDRFLFHSVLQSCLAQASAILYTRSELPRYSHTPHRPASVR